MAFFEIQSFAKISTFKNRPNEFLKFSWKHRKGRELFRAGACLCAHGCVCASACVCVYLRVYMGVHVQVCVCVCVWMCMCMCVCVCVDVDVILYIGLCAHVRASGCSPVLLCVCV